MFRFSSNENACTLNCQENYLEIGVTRFELSDEELKYPNKIYLKITNDCNLNCIYCFQKHDSREDSEFEILNYDNIFLKLIDENCEIIVFGGEPLIDQNINKLHQIFRMVQQVGVTIFTNGCYSLRMRELINANKKLINCLNITLDGPKNIHNRRRIYPGNDSFSIIVDNLIELKKIGIPFIIQVNVDSENIEYIGQLIIDLDKSLGLNNFQIILNRVLREANTIEELYLLKKYIEILEKFPDVNIDLNSKVYNNLATYISGNGICRERCGIGRATKIVDFMTKKIYACPHDTKTEIGYFTNNNIDLNDLSIQEMINVSNKRNNTCDQCRYIKFCSYGCYLEKDKANEKCKEEMKKIMEFILSNFNKFFVVSVE